jgi:hypothetical protein
MRYPLNKIWSILSLSILTLAASPLLAELNVDDYTTEKLLINEADKSEDQCPFSLSVDFNATGKAKFEHKRCQRHLKDVEFAIASVDGSMVFYYNPHCKEGLLATASYTYTRIKWENPFFEQSHFDTVSLGIGGFTERAANWLWQAQVLLNADVDYFEASQNLYWNLVLSGRYAYTDNVGLYIGFIAFTGMKIDRVWPIIGFDWQINKSWKLNLVYPVNVGIVYSWNSEWSLAVQGRALDERHRVGKAKRDCFWDRWDKSDEWDRGLLEYRATGIEGSIRYKSCNGRWQAELHAGEILGGRVKVSNRHHRHSHRFNFKTAPYVGGELAAKF